MEATRDGFEVEFVEKPPKAIQCECPVCLLVLREPYQVTCCGYSFCRGCIVSICDGKTCCPCCKAKKSNHFPNKGLQRSLYEFKVYCSNKTQGCQWVGELGQLESHLNCYSVSGTISTSDIKRQTVCEYAKVKCRYCQKFFQRSSIEEHQLHQCPNRSFVCEYCKDYESTYEDVITNHWLLCDHYPLKCPNKCDKVIERKEVQNHIANDCPLTLIDCDFKHVGCQAKLPRRLMKNHFTTDIAEHLSLQLTGQLRLISKTDDLEKTLSKKGYSGNLENERKQMAVKIEKLEKFQSRTSEKIAALERQNKNAVTRRTEHNKNKNKENDISGWTRCLYILGFILMFMVISNIGSIGRAVSENAKLKQEVDLLIQVAHIQSLEKLNPKLSRDGYFQQELQSVLSILQDDPEEAKTKLNDLQNLTMTLPMEITMNDLQQHIFHNDTWYSRPFYTHYRGYKMCLAVDANGYDDGYGTHVSVFLLLMKGDFDNKLSWPLKGEFTIQLLNQRQAMNATKYYKSATRTLHYNGSLPSDADLRVTEEERSDSGWGFHRFISHNKLWPNYLSASDGSLLFNITYSEV